MNGVTSVGKGPPRIDTFLKENFEYRDDPIFSEPDVEEQLFYFKEGRPQLPSVYWYGAIHELSPEECSTQQYLMSREEERLMFLRMNYCKKRLVELQAKLLESPDEETLRVQFAHWHADLVFFHDYILHSNLSLCLFMMQKRRWKWFFDRDVIVSESNETLLRAIKRFSVSRNIHFSTYACRAIANIHNRLEAVAEREMQKRRKVTWNPKKEKSNWAKQKHQEALEWTLEDFREVLEKNIPGLSEREQIAVRMRYRAGPAPTLAQIGKIIGITKEGVRQLLKRALAKIRKVMKSILTGAPVQISESILHEAATP